jgi:hypothetical protein
MINPDIGFTSDVIRDPVRFHLSKPVDFHELRRAVLGHIAA